MFLIKTNATALAVSLADAKAHCVVEHDDHDALLTSYIMAAVRKVEDDTGLLAVPVEVEWRLNCWVDPITIPAKPVRDVTAITYLDEDDQEQTVDGSLWYWAPTGAGAEVHFLSDFPYPDLSDRIQAVRVTVEAGYDDPEVAETDPNFVPDPRLKQAIGLLVCHWYEHREAVVIAGSAMTVPMAYDTLVSQMKIYR